MLIEDNPDDEALIVRSLRRNSIVNPIHVARDGAEALEYLFRDPAAPGPGIILLDLRLPKVDGLEILRQIRATPATKTLPVAVLTSSEDEMDALVSQGCGADAILAKIVTTSTILIENYFAFGDRCRIISGGTGI